MSDVDEPTFRIAKGNPTDEEMAAVLAVIAGLAAARRPRKVAPEIALGGGWKSYWHVIRQPLDPGRESWRATFRR